MRLFSSPTVTSEWLASYRRHVVVVEVGNPFDGDDGAGHVSGAVVVDDACLELDSTTGPAPDVTVVARVIADAGIAEGTPVVVYDRGDGTRAARLWWLLHVLDQPCAVLDGGLASWDGPRDRALPRPSAVARSASSWPAERFLDVTAALLWRRRGEAVLLDAGAAAGEDLPSPRPTSLLGARRADWTGSLDPATGRFLPRLELRRRFESIGAHHRLPVLAYAETWAQACHLLLALELAALGPTALVVDARRSFPAVSDPVPVGATRT